MYGASYDLLYGPGMTEPIDPDATKITFMGVDEARKHFAQRINAADDEGEQTIVTRHGKPTAVLVSMEWFREATRCLGKPTTL